MLQIQNSLALLLTVSAASVLLGSGSPARADALGSKGDTFLTRQAAAHPKHGWSRVIARIEGDLSALQLRQLKALNVDIYRHLTIIHSVALTLPTRNLEKLAALPFVEHLSADLGVTKSDEFTQESSGASLAAQRYGVTGKNVTVAVLDSGIRTCQDLPGSMVIDSVTFVRPSGGDQPGNWPGNKPGAKPGLNDMCGHGTHVAGIIAGNGLASSDSSSFRHFKGIAPGAKVVNVRVLDKNGQGAVSQVVSGIQWCVANRARFSIRIINLSLGHPVGESYTTDPLCQAVESAWKAGIVVVCAAGNDGRLNALSSTVTENEGYGISYGSIQSPGNDPYVITVGAMKPTDMVFAASGKWTHNRANDHIATYSSRGPSRLDLVLKPDIVAPGNKVISLYADNTLLTNQYASTNAVAASVYSSDPTASSNKYYILSGTSMAAPVVTGAIALMLEKSPRLTPDTIKARLMISADKWADPAGNADPCTYGAGYLNIPAALASTSSPTQPALSPTMSVDTDGNVYINADRSLWGSDTNGACAVWGINGVNDLRAVWGAKAIWGSSTNVLDASNAIWGRSVWGDEAVWGASTSAVDLSSTALKGD